MLLVGIAARGDELAVLDLGGDLLADPAEVEDPGPVPSCVR
jgi:hypothetical protein